MLVAPFTTQPPRNPDAAVEAPEAVLRHLRLETDRAWIMCDEINEFTWPGFDLRVTPRTDALGVYGYLPPKLYRRVRDAVASRFRAQRLARVPRDD